MSVQTEIDRINSAKSGIAASIEAKGVTVPSGTKLDGMASLISSIPQGGLVPVVEIAGTYSSGTVLRFTHDANTLDAGMYLVEITFTRSSAEYKCFMWLLVSTNSKTGQNSYTAGYIGKPSNACTVDGSDWLAISSAASSGGAYFTITASGSTTFTTATVSSAKLYRAEDVFA